MSKQIKTLVAAIHYAIGTLPDYPGQRDNAIALTDDQACDVSSVKERLIAALDASDKPLDSCSQARVLVAMDAALNTLRTPEWHNSGAYRAVHDALAPLCRDAAADQALSKELGWNLESNREGT